MLQVRNILRMTNSHTVLAACLLPLAGLGCSSETFDPAAEANPAISVDAVLAEYASYRAMTDGPVPIDPDLWFRCKRATGVPPESQETYGPHAEFLGVYYMNPSAAGAFEEQTHRYPPGSVVVKEKQASYLDKEMTGPGLAGMIKRDAGFDPEHGDWEYFFVDHDTPLSQGKLPSCIDCHSRVADRDYVFGGWIDKGW